MHINSSNIGTGNLPTYQCPNIARERTAPGLEFPGGFTRPPRKMAGFCTPLWDPLRAMHNVNRAGTISSTPPRTNPLMQNSITYSQRVDPPRRQPEITPIPMTLVSISEDQHSVLRTPPSPLPLRTFLNSQPSTLNSPSTTIRE